MVAWMGGQHGQQWLSRQTAKLNAVKEQIKICVKRISWSDLHHPWSENGVEFLPDALLAHLVNNIVPQQSKHRLPSNTTIKLPSRNHMPQLGTQLTNVALLEEQYEIERDDAVAKAVELCKQTEKMEPLFIMRNITKI